MSGCYESKDDAKIEHEESRVNFCIMCTEPFPKCKCMWKAIREIESHLNKLHDMINIEDRITACDVLNRLTLLESSKLNQELVNERLKNLETFGTDINLRLIHQAVETHIEHFNERLSKIENCFSSVIESGKKIKISEYKSVVKNCTICEGNGILEGKYDCPKCLGKGKYI